MVLLTKRVPSIDTLFPTPIEERVDILFPKNPDLATVRESPTARDERVEITPDTVRFPVVLIELTTVSVELRAAAPCKLKFPATFRFDKVLTGPVRIVEPSTLRLVPAAILDGVEMKKFAKRELAIIFENLTVGPKFKFPPTAISPATERFLLINTFDKLLISPNVRRVLFRIVLPMTFRFELTDNAPPTFRFKTVDKFLYNSASSLTDSVLFSCVSRPTSSLYRVEILE